MDTFRDMQRQVQAKIQNTSTAVSQANDILPKIKDWINARYQRIYRSSFFPGSVDVYDQTLTASTVEFSFYRDIGNVISIFDKTNGKLIYEDTVQNHNRNNAINNDRTGNIVQDNPSRFRESGIYSVKIEVATAETIGVKSSSALDISPNVVRIEGMVGGALLGEDIVLTGTTIATSANTYDAGQKVAISAGTSDATRKTNVGFITATGTDSSSTYTVIEPSESAHMYRWFKVSPLTKATGTQPTWEITHRKSFRKLDNDNDIPIVDCSLEIIQGAYADALRDDGLEQEAVAADQMFAVLVNELKSSFKSNAMVDQFRPVNAGNKQYNQSSYDWV